GTLWIGTATGLLSWKDGRLVDRVGGRIAAIHEDRRHRIWVARALAEPSGGVCQVVGDHTDCIRGDEHVRVLAAAALAEDAEGNLWIGAANQLVRWRDGSLEAYGQELGGSTVPSVTSIAIDADRSVIAAIPGQGGLFRIEGGQSRQAVFPGIPTAD